MKYEVEFILQSNVFSSKAVTDNSLLCLEPWGREGNHHSSLVFVGLGEGAIFFKLFVCPRRGSFFPIPDPKVSDGAGIVM